MFRECISKAIISNGHLTLIRSGEDFYYKWKGTDTNWRWRHIGQVVWGIWCSDLVFSTLSVVNQYQRLTSLRKVHRKLLIAITYNATNQTFSLYYAFRTRRVLIIGHGVWNVSVVTWQLIKKGLYNFKSHTLLFNLYSQKFFQDHGISIILGHERTILILTLRIDLKCKFSYMNKFHKQVW